VGSQAETSTSYFVSSREPAPLLENILPDDFLRTTYQAVMAGTCPTSCSTLRTSPAPFAPGACVWARIGAVVYGVSQDYIAAYGRQRGTED
jgi:hypothetical protein